MVSVEVLTTFVRSGVERVPRLHPSPSSKHLFAVTLNAFGRSSAHSGCMADSKLSHPLSHQSGFSRATTRSRGQVSGGRMPDSQVIAPSFTLVGPSWASPEQAGS
jgi:hypothetical protein